MALQAVLLDSSPHVLSSLYTLQGLPDNASYDADLL